MTGVDFPNHGNPRYFTLDGYRDILVRALALEYRVVPFRDFDPPGGGRMGKPVLLLRHDLDRPLPSAQVFGEIEAELGIASTYFVQTACDLYNLLSRENRAIIRRLAEFGHEIGLHYEADRYIGNQGRSNLLADLRLIEDLSGMPVVSASQHIPIDGERIALSDYVENEAYEPRFTDAPMTYISDSLMVWRQATPHDLLDRGVSFQFLTHPDTWAAQYSNMGEAMADLMEVEVSRLRARYRELVGYYAQLLREREERDRRFGERQNEPAKTISDDE